MRRFVLPAAAGAAAAALIAASVATAGPSRGWVFGPMPSQANITFQTDSGQPATYEVFTSPQPVTGLVCPGGVHSSCSTEARPAGS